MASFISKLKKKGESVWKEIFAKRAECDKNGNVITDTYATQSSLNSTNSKVTTHSERIDELQESLDSHEDSLSNIKSSLTSHTQNKSNPHAVTKAQIGLDNVDNTSDLNKPISTATQKALNELNKSAAKVNSNNFYQGRNQYNFMLEVDDPIVDTGNPIEKAFYDYNKITYSYKGTEYDYDFPKKSGTLALLSDIPSLTIDTSKPYSWSGQHTFNSSYTYTKDIVPLSSVSYSLGSSSRYWNYAYISKLYMENNINSKNIIPLSDGSYNLGSSSNRYSYVYTRVVSALSSINISGNAVLALTTDYFNTAASPNSSSSFNTYQRMATYVLKDGSNTKIHIETHVVKLADNSSNDTRYNISFYSSYSYVPAVFIQLYNSDGRPSADWGASAIITNLTTSGVTLMKRFGEYGNFLIFVIGR